MRKYLVEDYCETVGLTDKQITQQKVDAAVRHMHKILLCDLNPLGEPPFPPSSARERCLISFHTPELSAVDRQAKGDDTCPIRR